MKTRRTKADRKIRNYLNQLVIDPEIAKQSSMPKIDHHDVAGDLDRHGSSFDLEFELVESDGEPEMGPELGVSSDEEIPDVVKNPVDPEADDPDIDWPEFFEAIKRPIHLPVTMGETKAKEQSGSLSLAFFGEVQQLHSLPQAEPEFIEVEMTLDTGASVHAINRLDLPGFVVTESEGSRAGQNFQAAGGKLIANEGQVLLSMLAPGTDCELTCNVQVAQVTRPLLSVTKMTESGKLSVVCKKDVAMILDENQKVLATFNRSGGFYVATMRVRNPRFQPFTRPGR